LLYERKTEKREERNNKEGGEKKRINCIRRWGGNDYRSANITEKKEKNYSTLEKRTRISLYFSKSKSHGPGPHPHRIGSSSAMGGDEGSSSSPLKRVKVHWKKSPHRKGSTIVLLRTQDPTAREEKQT